MSYMNKFEEQIIICKECLKGISQKINNNGVPSNNINYQNLYDELYKLSELLPTHLAIYQKRLHDFILPNLKVRDMVSYNQWGQQIIFPCTGINPYTLGEVIATLIYIDENKLDMKKHIYLVLNKPQGYISATEDRTAKTVLDLVPEQYMRKGLFPAGRLDKDTTGMMIITDDGEFAHNILAPRKHIEKTYRVQIDVDITEEMKEKFKQGIILKDHVCCPATIVVEDKNTALIPVTEGKYHQIKRMFGCFGAKVVNLHRISMGGLQLPSDLKEGQCRELTAEELEKVCIRDK